MSYLRSRPDLLRRFRAGESDALAEVYRAYLPLVTALLRRGFARRLSGDRIPGLANPDDLAEAIQDVFMRAFSQEARTAYDGLRDYWPYVATVARNAVVSRHRRLGCELLTTDPCAFSEPESIAYAGEQHAQEPWLDSRSLEIARAYLSSLPDPMRSVHAARYVNALSQRDAARVLGLSRPKVRKLEDKLRRGLHSLLIQAGIDVEASR